MSLINDVLKDLDRRDASATSAAAPTLEHRRAASPRRSRRWPLWIIAALALGVILHASLDGQSLSQGNSPTQALTAQAAEDPGVPSSAPADSGTSVRATNQAGESSLPGDSATGSGDIAAVQTAPPPTSTTRRGRQPDRDDQRSVDARDDSAQPSAEQARASAQAVHETPAEALQANPGQEEPTPSLESAGTEKATISIRRAGGERVESDALSDAKRLLSRGQTRRAEASLRQLIDEQPGLTEAHELLAGTLLRRRQHGAAIDVLESGLPQANDPAPLAALLGRLLIERGAITRARSVLEQHAPPMSEAADYHLLLAAAHRQASNHERAAQHYRKLTDHLPRRGAVWVGLGASLESLDRPREAVDAYRRALDGDDDRAALFARERLAALEPVIGEPQ